MKFEVSKTTDFDSGEHGTSFTNQAHSPLPSSSDRYSFGATPSNTPYSSISSKSKKQKVSEEEKEIESQSKKLEIEVEKENNRAKKDAEKIVAKQAEKVQVNKAVSFPPSISDSEDITEGTDYEDFMRALQIGFAGLSGKIKRIGDNLNRE